MIRDNVLYVEYCMYFVHGLSSSQLMCSFNWFQRMLHEVAHSMERIGKEFLSAKGGSEG